MTSPFDEWLAGKLHTVPEPLKRCLMPIDNQQFPEITIHGNPFITFTSNDYLGLAMHPDIIHALCQGAQMGGVGSGGSRLLGGDRQIYHDLERYVGDLSGGLKATLFNNAYQANVGLFPALCGPKDAIYCDKHCHASLLDGARLSGARLYRYAHLDMKHLQHLLHKTRHLYDRVWLVTESVFSMDGDRACVEDLMTLKRMFSACLLVDHTHGFGIDTSFILDPQVDVWVVGFGKAIGTCGAAVLGSSLLQNWLIQSCRSLIYSTMFPPAIAQATLASLHTIQTGNLQQKLWKNVNYFKDLLYTLDISFLGDSHIIPIPIGDEQRALDIACQLQSANMWVQAIRYPTVAKHQARLRIIVTAAHTESHLDTLAQELATCLSFNQ